MTFGLGVVTHDGKAGIWVAEVDYHEFKASIKPNKIKPKANFFLKKNEAFFQILPLTSFANFTCCFLGRNETWGR